MASIEATNSLRLSSTETLFNEGKKIVPTSFCSSSRHFVKPKRRNLFVVAGATNPGSIGMISKVNGVHVHEAVNMRNLKKTDDSPLHACLLGRFVEDNFVYRQAFIIRSYEIGPDKTATMETLMNLLQETALNHVTSSGLAGNGFGATREMSLRKLIWVVTRIHVQVQRHSRWYISISLEEIKYFAHGFSSQMIKFGRGDVVEIDTWVDGTGKNGLRRDWIIRDYHTQEIITRATSTWVIMNTETRRLSKIPEQVRLEILPYYLTSFAFDKEKKDVGKIDKLTDETAERIRSGLAPRWSDMDANQHVNNVKYIGWILESVPIHVLEDYSLRSLTLEYRRECRQSNLLESLTSTTASVTEDSMNNSSNNRRAELEYAHLLRMQADKAEIVRARTEWFSKQKHK